MAVTATGGDHMWIGDRDVVEVVSVDRVLPAIEFTPEGARWTSRWRSVP
jgi:hypothetical protein